MPSTHVLGEGVASIKDYIVYSPTSKQIRRAMSATFWKLIKKHVVTALKKDYKRVSENHPSLILEKSSPELGRSPATFSKSLTGVRLAKALMKFYAQGEYPDELNDTEGVLFETFVAILDLTEETAYEIFQSVQEK